MAKKTNIRTPETEETKQLIVTEEEIREKFFAFSLFPPSWKLEGGSFVFDWKDGCRLLRFFPIFYDFLKYNYATESWFFYDQKSKVWVEKTSNNFRELVSAILELSKMNKDPRAIESCVELYKIKGYVLKSPEKKRYFVFENGVYDVESEQLYDFAPKYFTTKGFHFALEKEQKPILNSGTYQEKEFLHIFRCLANLSLTGRKKGYFGSLEILGSRESVESVKNLFLKILGGMLEPEEVLFMSFHRFSESFKYFQNLSLIVIEEIPNENLKKEVLGKIKALAVAAEIRSRSLEKEVQNNYFVLVLCGNKKIDVTYQGPFSDLDMEEPLYPYLFPYPESSLKRSICLFLERPLAKDFLAPEIPAFMNWALALSSQDIKESLTSLVEYFPEMVRERYLDSKKAIALDQEYFCLGGILNFIQSRLLFHQDGEVPYDEILRSLKIFLMGFPFISQEYRKERRLMKSFEVLVLKIIQRHMPAFKIRKRKRLHLFYVGFSLKE